MESKPRVGIVGAGVTGTALAHYLHEQGGQPVVFEADDEAGGVVESVRVDGRVLEHGPQRTRLTPSIRELAAAAGVEEDLLTADGDLPLYVYHDGRLRTVPRSPGAAVTTDLLSWRGKLRALAEPLTDHGWDDETVGEFLTRKFGREVNERFMGLVYASIYGSDPDEMPMDRSLGEMLQAHGLADRSILLGALRKARSDRETPPVCSFVDGLQSLPAGLAAAHDERIHLDCPVTAVHERDEGFELVADGRTERVEEVVLTVPAAAAADLLDDVDPGTAGALADLRYNAMTEVYLRTDRDLSGLGFQVTDDAGLHTEGVTWNGGMFDHPTREGVVTCYVDDDGDRSDEALGDLARSEFRQVHDADAEVLSVHRWGPVMPAYDHSFDALDRIDPPEGVHLATNYCSRAGLPGRVRQAKGLAKQLAGDGEETARPKAAAD